MVALITRNLKVLIRISGATMRIEVGSCKVDTINKQWVGVVMALHDVAIYSSVEGWLSFDLALGDKTKLETVIINII